MNPFMRYAFVLITVMVFYSFQPTSRILEATDSNDEQFGGIKEELCRESFNDDVKTYNLFDAGQQMGYSIWISRKSQHAKAKYFGHKENGKYVHDRYSEWRNGKSVILKSSGAYATGWNGSDVPVGISVDNGNIVNRQYYDKMDGLVIVYATGGIAISNIEDGNLYLEALGEQVDVTQYDDRTKFLNWAEKEKATVFQTHLLAYQNRLQFGRAENTVERRKLLVLAKSNSGELFHIIFYTKARAYTLYNIASSLLQYLNNRKFDLIAMINLDTGGFDNLSTGETVRDCEGNFITGTSTNYADMTNLLAYVYE